MAKSQLTISEATERLKGMGAGETVLHLHKDGLVTTTAIGGVGTNLSKRQAEAEVLLQELLKQYEIVERSPPTWR